jgi:hypothetical protein
VLQGGGELLVPGSTECWRCGGGPTIDTGGAAGLSPGIGFSRSVVVSEVNMWDAAPDGVSAWVIFPERVHVQSAETVGSDVV